MSRGAALVWSGSGTLSAMNDASSARRLLEYMRAWQKIPASGSPATVRASADGDWWTPSVAGVAQESEFIFIHWLNAPVVMLAKIVLPLHEAARVASVLWAGIGIASIALAARRLHDINRSGWLQLMSLFFPIGFVALIVWYCTPPKEQSAD